MTEKRATPRGTKSKSFACPSFDAIGRIRHGRVECEAGCVVSVEERIEIKVLENIGIVQSSEIKIEVVLWERVMS